MPFNKSLLIKSALTAAMFMAASVSYGAEDVLSNSDGVKPSPTFKEADANQDGYITKDELKDYPILLDKFDSIDAGKDGKLGLHEYRNLVLEKRREKY